MACRTAANGAARQGTFDRMRAAGRDLAVIGGSSSGCELCADWEGEVVSLDGVTPGYPTLAEAEGAGLFHPNCTHQPYPYVPGLTQTSGIARSDAGTYEARQQQRYLERGIRGGRRARRWPWTTPQREPRRRRCASGRRGSASTSRPTA